MTASTPASLTALLAALLLLCPQAFGAIATLPLPVAGLPVYAVVSSDLLQSFGVGQGTAAEEPVAPEAARPDAVAPAPEADTEADHPLLGRERQLTDLEETWLGGAEHRRLRTALLAQKRAEYGYPPEGPTGSELLPEEAIPAPRRGDAELSPLIPDTEGEPGLTPRAPRSGPGWRYRHRGGLRAPDVTEGIGGRDGSNRGYLRRHRGLDDRELAPGPVGPRALPHGQSMEYNGPWPWELEKEREQAPDDTDTIQLRIEPVTPGTQLASTALPALR